MRQVAVADIGGTHARFAIAEIDGGRVVSLGEPVTLKTAEHGSFQLAWEEFGRQNGGLPNELAIAFAGPVGGEVLKLTNNPWVIRPYLMKERLGVDRYTIVNDFGAVGFAVATLGDEYFRSRFGCGFRQRIGIDRRRTDERLGVAVAFEMNRLEADRRGL